MYGRSKLDLNQMLMKNSAFVVSLKNKRRLLLKIMNNVYYSTFKEFIK